jgi:parallel beta-helix repeat protein
METTGRGEDLGLRAVARTFEQMAIDEPWAVREPRGFTWWGHWLRQRVWADDAVRSYGETLWHVRASTPALRGVADEPATCALVNEMNMLPGLSAYVFDPAEGTVSARCGAFTYDGVAGWVDRWFLMATGLQASVAWKQVPAMAEGRTLDDERHPVAGARNDPDDMLNAAVGLPRLPSPFLPAVLERAVDALVQEGFAASLDERRDILQVALPLPRSGSARWTLGRAEHPLLGPGTLAGLWLPSAHGPLRGAWLANALNLAESADWSGEARPHALGAWQWKPGSLFHLAFVPSVLTGSLADEAALVLVDTLAAWAGVRARFAAERLPWLDTAAAARHPDDPPAAEADPDGSAGEPVEQQPAEPTVPVRERPFGPSARTPRSRTSGVGQRAARELIVDQADPDAFEEIDDAVAEAEDGDRITVRPGTYRRPVVVDRAVVIAGEGTVEDIRLEPVGGEALGFAASGALVSGLSIRPARAGNDGEAWSAVAVHDVDATVERCELSSHLGATVWVGGPSSRLRLRDCSLRDGAQNAVWVAEEGRAELVGCRVAGHRWPLAVSGEHASLAVRGSEVVDCFDHGIAAVDGALLVVERTTLARNGRAGVLLGAAAPASRVKDSLVEGNGGPGVLIAAGRPRLARLRVIDNGVGIGVGEGGAPSVRDCQLERNRAGIWVRGEGTDPRVTGCSIDGSGAQGIIVDEAARGRFEANTVTGTRGPGIWIDDSGSLPIFTGNHVTGGTVGVLVTDAAGGELRSNDLRGNSEGSWRLDRPGPLVRADNLEDTGSTAGTVLPGVAPSRSPQPGPPTLLN